MININQNPFLSTGEPIIEVNKAELAKQLDEFAKEHNIKSLRDRLKWGLNEVGILAYEQTQTKVKELCTIFSETEEGADQLFENLVEMSVDIQEHGPWDFAKDLALAESPYVKLWYIVNTAESLGYEKDMELNDYEFNEDTQRILNHLNEAIKDPDEFLVKAKEHIQNKSAAAIYFDKDDKDKKIPRGEGWQAALPMALQGYKVGIYQDSDGWVYVMAQGMINDRLLESCGLTKKIQNDPRDPSRKVTVFLNDQGQEVVKKVHRGFLVILTKSFDLAQAIAEAVKDQKDVIEIADEALGHTRIIQTTEKQRDNDRDKDEEHWFRKQFIRRPEEKGLSDNAIESTALTSPKQDFYSQMLYIRGLYVYLDKVEKVKRKKEKESKEITDLDREEISERVWSKMKQKVEELQYVNELLQKESHGIPPNVHAVIDMAGGAGDLGLAVGTELIAQGRKLEDIEIVDTQEGVDDFMKNIIEHIPFREDFEKIAHHNTGFLQDANIRPDAIVVAKHACGTLTDAIIEQWINSDSPMLVAMTCCQEKAKNKPAQYGLDQQKWHDLCVLSGATGNELPEEPGVKREMAIKELERGKQAMYELDMARVEHLRRNGFKAELHTTDKFPKGDVIIARRLPKNFMAKVIELKKMERENPNAFDGMIMKLDKMVEGGDIKGERTILFGDEWIDDDFEELRDRLSPARIANEKEMTAKRRLNATKQYLSKQEEERKRDEKELADEKKKVEKAEYEKFLIAIFPDAKGKPNLFVDQWSRLHDVKIAKKQMGAVMAGIKNILQESKNEEPNEIRAMVEAFLIKNFG